MKKLILVLCCQAVMLALPAQPLVQTLKGTVVDGETHIPLPGAAVVILESDPLQGCITGPDGTFRMPGIRVGRYALRCSFMGYEDAVVRNIQVNSGKETVVRIGLRPSLLEVRGVEVSAQGSKEAPLNTMATLSARQLSMEEANRFAGGFDDPSRLASAFAGVASGLSSNGIVIRGNSPRGMLWRLEGVPVYNPNHFAEVTTFGGGGITALSSQVISNSDFFTGAFPAEYGNALSGVFDLRMRQGNRDRHEFTLKAGTIGLDAAAEGPLDRGHSASYLFNYRYSTLALIAPWLPENGGSVRYQDLSFKLQSKAGKNGTFTLWGIGSADGSGSRAKRDSTEWAYREDRQEVTSLTSMGAAGAGYKQVLSAGTLLSLSAGLAGNAVNYDADWFISETGMSPAERVGMKIWNTHLSTGLQHRFGKRHANKSGLSWRQLYYDLSMAHAGPGEALASTASGHGNRALFEAYSQSGIEVSESVSLNLGLHTVYFGLNGDLSLEPRTGLSWKVSPRQRLSLAYGLHSQTEMLPLYFIRGTADKARPNRDLPLSKAHHLVLAWDLSLNGKTHLKAELYYQYLFDIPVIRGTSFSMINLDRDWYIDQPLVPDGLGRNAGIDITLERYMDKGFYYLVTASLFDSRYRGGDGVWRDTRYNKKVVANLLAGKEWKVGKGGDNLLGLNGRVNLMGGDRMSPVDEAASLAAAEVVYDETRAFSRSKPDVYYVDLTLNYTRNRKRHASTWSVQLINLLARPEFNGYRYNSITDAIEEFREVTMVPNISYKIEF